MRLHRGAKLAIIVEIKSRHVAEVEGSGRAGIRAISAFANALQRNALGAEADGGGAEILRDFVDELAVGGDVEDFRSKIHSAQSPRPPVSAPAPLLHQLPSSG